MISSKAQYGFWFEKNSPILVNFSRWAQVTDAWRSAAFGHPPHYDVSVFVSFAAPGRRDQSMIMTVQGKHTVVTREKRTITFF